MSIAVFKHSPDNQITINDGDDNELTVSLAVFLTLEPAYTIQDGTVKPWITYTSRYYEPEVKHTLSTGSSVYAGDLPWADGDDYIANVTDYIDIINNPVVDLPTAKATKSTALDELYRQKLRDGGIDLFSTTMPSNKDYSSLTESYTRNAAVPASFYLMDTDNVAVPLTLMELQSYQDGIVEMGWEHRQVYDTHYDGIQACADIPAVDAYDFTTGWPTLPFVPT